MTLLPARNANTQCHGFQFVIDDDSSMQGKTSDSPSTPLRGDIGKPQEQRAGFKTGSESRPTSLIDNYKVQPDDGNSHSQRERVHNTERYELRNTKDLVHRTPSSESLPSPISLEMDNRWPLAGRSSLSDDEIGLLKYYSHHIAPWVSVHSR